MGFDKIDELEQEINNSNETNKTAHVRQFSKNDFLRIVLFVVLAGVAVFLYLKISAYIAYANREKFSDEESMRQQLQGSWKLEKSPDVLSRYIINEDQFIWVVWNAGEENDILITDSITWNPSEGTFIAMDEYEVKKGGNRIVCLNSADKDIYIKEYSKNEEIRCSWCGKVIRYDGYNIHATEVLNGNTLECEYCGHKTNYR